MNTLVKVLNILFKFWIRFIKLWNSLSVNILDMLYQAMDTLFQVVSLFLNPLVYIFSLVWSAGFIVLNSVYKNLKTMSKNRKLGNVSKQLKTLSSLKNCVKNFELSKISKKSVEEGIIFVWWIIPSSSIIPLLKVIPLLPQISWK